MVKIDKKYDMEMLFRALADPTRLRLINLMSGGEICVCFFVEVLGTNQPKISRHLAYLKRAGIVSARREGKWISYRISTPDNPHAARVLSDVQAWLAQDKEMQRERAQLMKVCCAPNPPVQLQGAPKPAVYELVNINRAP